MTSRKKKNMLIVMLCFTLVFMGIGYSILSTQLNISGVGKVVGNFAIEITHVDETSDSLNNGAVLVKNAEISEDKLSVNISAGFNAPGDYLEYDITVSNNGTIDALLNAVNVELLPDSAVESSSYFTVSHTASTTYPDNVLRTGDTMLFQVKLLFNEDSTIIPDGKVYHNISLEFVQSGIDSIPEIPEEDKACFISVIPGEINSYSDNCSRDVVIPEGLELPVSQVETISFNEAKCQAVAPMLDSNTEPATLCTQMKSQFDTMSPEAIYGSMYSVFADATFSVSDTTQNEITKVGIGAFGLDNITSIDISNNINELADYSFGINQISNLTLENGVNTIGDFAFALNQINGNLTIPNSVSMVGQSSFDSNQITSLTLGTGLTFIGASAFNRNQISEELIIPSSVTTIGDYAFINNQISGELVIPASVVTIGERAFQGSYDGSTNQISSLTFASGSKLETIGTYAFAWNQISGELVIPASVVIIGDAAFSGSSDGSTNQISSLTFASGSKLETIGTYAFLNNQISGELIIPASVTTIGEWAFSGSSDGSTNKISSLTFESGSKLDTIGTYAFHNNRISGHLILPESLTIISDGAFSNNKFETLNIGSNITTIGAYAFVLNSYLTVININMTESEFANVSKVEPWYDSNPTINYNS